MAAPASNIPPRRILIRGVNWLGDAVMTTPALLRLRERFPEAYVTMLTPGKLRDLWVNHPAVNDTISIEPGEGVFAVARKLRAAQTDARPSGFDLALVLPNSPRSAMEAWLARIPVRVGHARPWRNFFLTTAVPPRANAVKMRKRSVAEIEQLVKSEGRTQKAEIPAAAHQVHDFLHLVAALGASPELLAPQLRVAADEIEAVRKKFGLENISRPIFGLNPGAEYGPAKRWPAENFAAAAQEIQKRTNCAWLIFGGKGDVAIASQIQSTIRNPESPVMNLAGQTSLRELMAALKLCRVLVTNDTGPMHLAAALGVPVVVPFGSTSPELTGPISAASVRHELIKSDAPCSPCFLRECPIDFRCMKGISVESVAEAVLRISADFRSAK